MANRYARASRSLYAGSIVFANRVRTPITKRITLLSIVESTNVCEAIPSAPIMKPMIINHSAMLGSEPFKLNLRAIFITTFYFKKTHVAGLK